MVRFVEVQRDEEDGGESSSSSESEAEEEVEQQFGSRAPSSDEDCADEQEERPENRQAGARHDPTRSRGSQGAPPARIKISLSRAIWCHVCGKKGHNAGFQGATYVDCPNKPCYLCKQPGHTTAGCPHNIDAKRAGVMSSPPSQGSLTSKLIARQLGSPAEVSGFLQAQWQVDAAVLKLHSRRCTCLEFHPTRDNIVLSGDKKGQVAVWNFEKVYERTLYNMNRALTNNLRFVPGSDYDCISASSDGKLRMFDVETGIDEVLLDLNPGGWIEGVTTEKDWCMLYALDASSANNLIIAGDSWGNAHFVDLRSKKKVGSRAIHKKSKVNTIHVNPVEQHMVLTAGNDWMARLFDLRVLISSLPSATSTPAGKKMEDAPGQLGVLEHSKVVNSAYFSPWTGRKVLTTCIDNRLRVWDFLAGRMGPEPDREIVHSHDFNRYLTPFRAEWDPKDPSERVVVIGRYISSDYDGQALHPIDMYDAGTGTLLTSLIDPNLETICPVNKPHPRVDALVTGSSRSLYVWRPMFPDEEGDPDSTSRKAGSGRPAAHTFKVCNNDENGVDDEKKKKRARTGAANGTTNGTAVQDEDEEEDDANGDAGVGTKRAAANGGKKGQARGGGASVEGKKAARKGEEEKRGGQRGAPSGKGDSRDKGARKRKGG